MLIFKGLYKVIYNSLFPVDKDLGDGIFFKGEEKEQNDLPSFTEIEPPLPPSPIDWHQIAIKASFP